MKFQFYRPEEKESQDSPGEFLPSMAFIIFSRKQMDSDHELQGVYTRRVPQVMKIKMDLISRFNTNFILPLDKTNGSPSYLETKPGSPWTSPEFIGKFERFDYMVGGMLSLDSKFLQIQLYSRADGKIIYEREYLGGKDQYVKFISDYLSDMVLFFEMLPSEEERLILRDRPARNPRSLEYLLQALDNDPLNPLDSDDHTKFIQYLVSAYKEEPENIDIPDILVNFAARLNRKGEVQTAKEVVNQILSINGSFRKALILLVRILLSNKEYKEVLELLDKVIMKDKNLADIYYILARENMDMEGKEIIKRLFEKAIEFNSTNPDIYDSYGYFLASTGDMKSALEIFKKGLDFSFDRESSLINTAQSYISLERFDEAKSIYERGNLLYPDSPKLLASRAIYHALRNDNLEARKSINMALERSPEDPLINLTASRIFDHLKDGERAIRFAKTTIDLHPTQVIAEEAIYFLSRVIAGISEKEQMKNRDVFLNAVIELRRKRYKESIDIIDKVIEVEPEYWRAWFLRGIAQRMLKDYDQALESFKCVDELFPDQVSLHHEIAKCLMGKEMFAQAFGHMRYAFRNNSEDPEIMGNMALVYMYIGRLNEAEILFSQTKKMDPANKNIDKYIDELERLKKRKRSSRGNGGASK